MKEKIFVIQLQVNGCVRFLCVAFYANMKISV